MTASFRNPKFAFHNWQIVDFEEELAGAKN
jgi:hypothetical protein